MQTQIATLSAFVTLDVNGPNEVDAALAELDDPSAVRTALRRPAGPLSDGTPTAGVLGNEVCKRGAGSGYTTGTIRSPRASKRIEDEQGVSLLAIGVLLGGCQIVQRTAAGCRARSFASATFYDMCSAQNFKDFRGRTGKIEFDEAIQVKRLLRFGKQNAGTQAAILLHNRWP